MLHHTSSGVPDFGSPGVARSQSATLPDETTRSWAALAHLIAGRPRVRVSKDGGRSYPQKVERALGTLPTQPAAVMLHAPDGTCRTLCLDFDSSRGAAGQVDLEVGAVRNLLTRHGIRHFEDISPNGGRHLYVPLAVPLPFHDSRELVEALARRFHTLDASPHRNIIHGCIRPPGARHKTGGHQHLVTEINHAIDIAHRPARPEAVDRLKTDLRSEIQAVRATRLEAVSTEEPAVDTRSVRGIPSTARDGNWDSNRYTSPSEARQAIIVAAAAQGLSPTDIHARMVQGIWPGLAQFYARYSANNRMGALQRDHRKATRYLGTRKPGEGMKSTHRTHTSQPLTQGGGSKGFKENSEHKFIRGWRSVLAAAELRYSPTRAGLVRRMLLRALGEAAHKTESRFIEFGARAFALATGVDHSTVAGHLRALRTEEDPLVVLIERGRGTKGDLYMLNIPDSFAGTAENVTWVKGRLHALRPVFRELGIPAALVYEQLERRSARTAELVKATGLSRSAVDEALLVLSSWGLAGRDGLSWLAETGIGLGRLAEMLGVIEAVTAQHRRHVAERAAWRRWLEVRAASQPLLPSPTDDYPWEIYEPPEDDDTLGSWGMTA